MISIVFRILSWCFRLLILWMLVFCTYATVVGLKDFKGQADIAVVLGNEVYKDGRLSPELKSRVDAALILYRNNQVKKIMVSGGIGDSEFPEGDAMRNYLVKAGVPDSVIYTDNKGANSYLTAKNFIELNKSEHFRSCVVVSSFYHVLRCRYIIQKLGFENVSTDHSRKFFIRNIFGLVREFFAYYKYKMVY